MISLLESCGLFALKHPDRGFMGEEAGGQHEHCEVPVRTYVLAVAGSLEKLFFFFLTIFLLLVSSIILSFSRLNLHVQYCIHILRP
eukprot:s1590_g28.t1